MRQDNRGLSIVEIIIVVAIMSVITGALFIGVNMVSDKPSMKCAQKIVYSLDRHRTSAMGKVSASYVLKKDTADSQVVLVETIQSEGASPEITTVALGDHTVEVSYVIGTSGTPVSLTGGTLELSFERGSGAFKKQAGGEYCTQIIVSRGGDSKEFIIELSPITGRAQIKE